MNVLESIMAERAQAVAEARDTVSIDALREAAQQRVHHSLVDRLQTRCGGTCIIAEMKKASPSAGLLRPAYEPATIAEAYLAQGACGISVLTEPKHFLGSSEHIRQVRGAVDLPILRKDFMCDPYQVVEAAAWGADIVLVILAALEREAAQRLYDEAIGLGMEVLAETHTAGEIRVALEFERAIIGVNSRNLKTLKTDLVVAETLASEIPADRLSIAESGIKTRADIEKLEACGYDGFLIGEALMKDDSPGGKLGELLGK